jgi:dTMP kinase
MHFIVLEGLDGAGKSTQVSLIKDYLEQKNIQTKFLHFPRTDSPFYGDMIARFLRGEFGNLDNVNPYIVALLYAGDRKDASETICKWLAENFVVIADRYVYSNIAYQCAKLHSEDEKIKLRDWILNFEFQYYKIPQPSINLFLDVPFIFTKNKLTHARTGQERDYLQGVHDIHEENLSFQEQVRQEYLNLCQSEKNFIKIDCNSEAFEMLPPDLIFNKIKHQLDSKLK